MSLLDIVAVILAGVAAGTINAIVGSGTLVTFPTLLVLGFPPLVANMSNNVGLLPGGLAGAYGYRRELVGRGPLLRRLVPPAVLGGIVGALLLLVLPSSVFDAVVPVLVAAGLVLVVVGPRLQRAAAARHESGVAAHSPVLVSVAVFLTGMYGGYFGAAQGIILVGLLSILIQDELQSINAMKNVVVPMVNLVAAIIFVSLRMSDINWIVVLLIGIGSFAGGLLGAGIGRRLPPLVLRSVILVVGLVALVRLLTT